MKTVFLIAVAVLAGTAGFSQVRVGGQVSGALNSGYFETTAALNLSQKPKAGFGAGIVSEISLTEKFSLRPSLNFSKRGIRLTGKAENPNGAGAVEATMDANLNYIELPVVFAYNIPLNTSKVYFGIGPSVGYGITGKTKVTYSVKSPGAPASNETDKIASFKKDADGGADFKRLDAGATIIAGIQFDNGLFVNAGGAYGLTNNFASEGKYQSRSVQLTVGFLLK